MRIKKSLTTRLMLSIVLVIIVMSVLNLLWSVYQYRQQAEAEMKEKAAVIAQQLMATRAFIAEQQDIINYDEKGNFQFKHLNPAAVGKGLGDVFWQYTGYRLKQTRLQSRLPENAPDAFEAEKLKIMAANPGLEEVWGYDTVEGERVFRYLLPLYYAEECLACHGGPAGEKDIAGYAKEGKAAGDFAGAISVVFSTSNLEKNLRDNIILQISYLLIILLATIGVIYLMMGRIVVAPLQELTRKAGELGKGNWEAHINPENAYAEMRSLGLAFNSMADKLQNLYANLEDKVEERTRMLRQANVRLQEQSEELQRMNARLSEADRLKSEFLAVMSHELRTPLTAIIAFTETLLAEREDLNALQQEYLNDILESAHILHGQVNDILDMSKIEAGLVHLNYRSFQIEEVLDSLKYSLGALFSGKDVQLAAEIDSRTPSLEADYDKIRHIMQNLLSNALKFTPEHGKIKVIVEPWQEEEDGWAGIRIEVSDNGTGIKEEDIPYIFDKFWQTNFADRQYSGSGLGLAIVKNFVELHGGRIQVDSKWGQGTVIAFVLPAKPGGMEGKREE